MDHFDKYKFKSDNPNEFGIDLKKFKKNEILDESHLSNLLSHSIRISEDILPSVSQSIDAVIEKLEIKNEFDFFVTSDNYQANASCSLMSPFSKPFIILTSKLIELLSEKELEFVIGHEVAHYIYQHSLYPNHQNEENRNLRLNILNLSRAAEISADRIGILACGDLEAALRANIKLTSGLSDKYLNFKFSAYLDQLREIETIGKSNNQLWSTHPSFLIRMQALIWFSMTDEFNEFFKTKKKGTYNIAEIDEKIENSKQKMIGNEIETSNQEIINRAFMWGSLNLYLSDKKFTKYEQEEFKKAFGDDAKKTISLIKITDKNMLQKKVDSSFLEASKMLKTNKNKLIDKLKRVAEEISGDVKKKKNVLNDLIKSLE